MAITWLWTKAETLRTQDRPWYLAVNFVNPHDVMYFDSDLPTQKVQGLRYAMPIASAPDDELYSATWDDHPLPASRHQPFDNPGRPVAQNLYQQVLDLLSGNDRTKIAAGGRKPACTRSDRRPCSTSTCCPTRTRNGRR